VEGVEVTQHDCGIPVVLEEPAADFTGTCERLALYITLIVDFFEKHPHFALFEKKIN
jgi:hypothetical protein